MWHKGLDTRTYGVRNESVDTIFRFIPVKYVYYYYLEVGVGVHAEPLLGGEAPSAALHKGPEREHHRHQQLPRVSHQHVAQLAQQRARRVAPGNTREAPRMSVTQCRTVSHLAIRERRLE
eukprot:1184326-Prorocentrum_minimum.AAC.3